MSETANENNGTAAESAKVQIRAPGDPQDGVPLQPPPIDPSEYNLTETEAAFFRSQARIQDDEELKQHILHAQAEAYKVYPYPCIRHFAFTTLKISNLPAYPDLLKLGRERPGAIFIDFGCCFGNDARKAIADGYPVQNVLGTDLRKEFWNLGHVLFRDTPETFPVPFIAGDVFDPDHIAPAETFYTAPKTTPPPLKTLTSLTPLQGHVSAIHASAFFHLFNEEEQLRIARILASLLSPEPGSLILGSHAAEPVKGVRKWGNDLGLRMFCHSPNSWSELWDGVVFKKGTVRVDAELLQQKPRRREGEAGPDEVAFHQYYNLKWSVTRL